MEEGVAATEEEGVAAAFQESAKAASAAAEATRR